MDTNDKNAVEQEEARRSMRFAAFLDSIHSESEEHEALRRRRRRRRARWCNWLGAALGIIFVAPFAILVLDHRAPITLHDGFITPSPAVPGQEATVTYSATEHRACAGEFSRRIVDSSGKIHEFAREATAYHLEGPAVGRRNFVKKFIIPEGVSEGRAVYYVLGYRWCNQLQKYIWPIAFRGPDIAFNVELRQDSLRRRPAFLRMR